MRNSSIALWLQLLCTNMLVVTLQQMAAVCKPEGKLILLEHGKASWDFLNSSLDQGAQEHFAKWGCWWNRDILRLVNEVRTCRGAMSLGCQACCWKVLLNLD